MRSRLAYQSTLQNQHLARSRPAGSRFGQTCRASRILSGTALYTAIPCAFIWLGTRGRMKVLFFLFLWANVKAELI